MSKKEIQEIDITKIFEICKGTDVEGTPVCGTSLSEVTYNTSTQKKIKEASCFLEGASLDFSVDGGSAVIVADFPGKCTSTYKMALRKCKDWLQEKFTEREEVVVLSLVVVPLLLSEVAIEFLNLVYVYGIEMERGKKRLILVFDNNMTRYYGVEGINTEEVMKRIEEEIEAEKESLMDEIQELEDEIKELENDTMNPFANIADTDYNPELLPENEEDEVDDGAVRTKKKYVGMRVAEDEE